MNYFNTETHIHSLHVPDSKIDFYINSNINSTLHRTNFPESSESTVNKTIIIKNTDLKEK